MSEPKFKLDDRVIWDGDEGVIYRIDINIDPDTQVESVWYTVDIGYTYVGAHEEHLERV